MPKEMVKGEKHYLNELKEMIRDAKEPKEEVFATFCHRHGISLTQCRKYYEKLVSQGEIKEK